MVSLQPHNTSYSYSFMYDLCDYPSEEEFSNVIKGSILEYLINSNNHKVYLHILKVSGLSHVLNEENFNGTVFIPDDEYISDKNYYMNIEKGDAYNIIKYSMLNRKVNSDLLKASPSSYLITKNTQYKKIYIQNIDNITTIQLCVKLIKGDIIRNNGIVHMTDGILYPMKD